MKFFAVAKDGTCTEITDLYWFEENHAHTLDGVAVDGSRVEVEWPSARTAATGSRTAAA